MSEKIKSELTDNTINGRECYYCGLVHKGNEAGGMWHCKNLLCKGPGAAWFRSTLESYKDNGLNHSVDENEWIYKAKKYQEEHHDYVCILWKNHRGQND